MPSDYHISSMRLSYVCLVTVCAVLADLREQDGGEGSAQTGGEGLVEWLCHVTVLHVPCDCLIYVQ